MPTLPHNPERFPATGAQAEMAPVTAEAALAAETLPTTPIIEAHGRTLQEGGAFAEFIGNTITTMEENRSHNALYFEQLALLLARTEFSEKHITEFIESLADDEGLYARLQAFETQLAVQHAAHLGVRVVQNKVAKNKPEALDNQNTALEIRLALEQNAAATTAAREALEAELRADEQARNREWAEAVAAARKEAGLDEEELRILFQDPKVRVPEREVNPQLVAAHEEWTANETAASDALRKAVNDFHRKRDRFMNLAALEVKLQRQDRAHHGTAPALQAQTAELADELQAVEAELNILLEDYVATNAAFRAFTWEAFGAEDKLPELYQHGHEPSSGEEKTSEQTLMPEQEDTHTTVPADDEEDDWVLVAKRRTGEG